MSACQKCNGLGYITGGLQSGCQCPGCAGKGEVTKRDKTLAEWIFHQWRYQAIDEGSQLWIRRRELAVEQDFDSWEVVKIL